MGIMFPLLPPLREGSLVDLDCGINLSDKNICAYIAYSTTHDTKCQTEQGHMSKIESCLEKSIHFGLEEEVIKRIKIYIEGG